MVFIARLLLICSITATVECKRYDVNSGILLRVAEYLERFMKTPVQAIRIIKKYHENQGFAGRDDVLTYLYSLIESFDGITLYFGTEDGEYYSYFDSEVVYREPGNSGYDPDDPQLSIYYNICTDGNDGTVTNCTMSVGSQYVKCVNGCELVECENQFVDDCDQYPYPSVENLECLKETEIRWCKNYTIETVQEGETLGYVPTSYHCFDETGLISGTVGEVLQSYEELPGLAFPGGSCLHWDFSPVIGVHTGPFASCGGEVCNTTYVGMMRTVEYDPRRRPWYIDTKASQQATWFSPYPFHTHSSIIQRIGISYTEPYYSYDENGMKLFAGVFAVDYTLNEISEFLLENYGSSDDLVVMIFEANDPHYLIGTSTGAFPYREVLSADESSPCGGSEDCVTIRVKATEVVNDFSHKLDPIAVAAARAQVDAGIPFKEIVTVEPDNEDVSAAGYICQTIPYKQPGTSLDWVIVVVSPMVRSTTDRIVPGDPLYVIVIAMAVLGILGCAILLTSWCRRRGAIDVQYGDFSFTSAFMVGCILMNVSSLTGIGETSDSICMLRMWSTGLSFTLATVPLLVKIFRVYCLIGGKSIRRRTITNKQSIFLSIPIIAVEVIILLVFSLVDPPLAARSYNFEFEPPLQSVVCEDDSNAFFFTQLAYNALLVIAGCFLSFLSRNVDSNFGEAKQLFFGMYNVAFTGIGYLMLMTLVKDVSHSTLHSFRTILVFWGTVLTCAVFVVPRLFRAQQRARRRISSGAVVISGLDVADLDVSCNFTPATVGKAPPRVSFVAASDSNDSSKNIEIASKSDIVNYHDFKTPQISHKNEAQSDMTSGSIGGVIIPGSESEQIYDA